MKECVVLFSGCDDPERWSQTQDFIRRIKPAIDGESHAEVHFNKTGDVLLKLQVDDDVIDFVRMVANECDCDDLVFHNKITITDVSIP